MELPFDAVVLAGGGGSRLGGIDKADLRLAGTTLLDRVLCALSHAACTVVVGPARTLPAGVLSAQENPPGAGPVAALAAGLDALPAPGTGQGGLANAPVVVLACDLPFITEADVARLVESAAEAPDGAVFVDVDGRTQPLAAAYDRDRLRRAISWLDRVDGAAMRDLTSRLTLLGIPADPETTLDCDTWDDVLRSRERLEER